MSLNDLTDIQRAIHALSQSDRAKLRSYVLTVFNVRGRDTRVNLTAADFDRPRER